MNISNEFTNLAPQGRNREEIVIPLEQLAKAFTCILERVFTFESTPGTEFRKSFT